MAMLYIIPNAKLNIDTPSIKNSCSKLFAYAPITIPPANGTKVPKREIFFLFILVALYFFNLCHISP